MGAEEGELEKASREWHNSKYGPDPYTTILRTEQIEEPNFALTDESIEWPGDDLEYSNDVIEDDIPGDQVQYKAVMDNHGSQQKGLRILTKTVGGMETETLPTRIARRDVGSCGRRGIPQRSLSPVSVSTQGLAAQLKMGR